MAQVGVWIVVGGVCVHPLRGTEYLVLFYVFFSSLKYSVDRDIFFFSKQQTPYSFSGILFQLFTVCINSHENEAAISLMLIFLYVQCFREESYQ